MRGSHETTDEQFDRLPKHAQVLINRLDREAQSYVRKIAELEAELKAEVGDDAKIFYSHHRDLDVLHQRPLPSGAYLHFRVGPGEVRVMVQYDSKGNEWLDLNADQSLTVAPTSTNAIRVHHVSRYHS